MWEQLGWILQPAWAETSVHPKVSSYISRHSLRVDKQLGPAADALAYTLCGRKRTHTCRAVNTTHVAAIMPAALPGTRDKSSLISWSTALTMRVAVHLQTTEPEQR